jgi:CheY-like chemotaxis protein
MFQLRLPDLRLGRGRQIGALRPSRTATYSRRGRWDGEQVSPKKTRSWMTMSTPRDGAGAILIVDDHEMTARSVARILRSAGYITDVALSGTDAIAKAIQAPPKAAVIDIHLPDLNGLVLSSQLRQRLGPDVPLLVMSGDTSLETIRTLPYVGATYFLSKPIKSAALLEILRKWLPDPFGPATTAPA